MKIERKATHVDPYLGDEVFTGYNKNMPNWAVLFGRQTSTTVDKTLQRFILNMSLIHKYVGTIKKNTHLKKTHNRKKRSR